MFGKRGRQSVGRAPATPTDLRTARTADIFLEVSSLSSKITDPLDFLELLPLRYFEILIQGEPLRALVDSRSNRTILGVDGIDYPTTEATD